MCSMRQSAWQSLTTKTHKRRACKSMSSDSMRYQDATRKTQNTVQQRSSNSKGIQSVTSSVTFIKKRYPCPMLPAGGGFRARAGSQQCLARGVALSGRRCFFVDMRRCRVCIVFDLQCFMVFACSVAKSNNLTRLRPASRWIPSSPSIAR